MDHEKMTVLVIEPEKKPYVKDISSGLASLQKEVGGYIQAVYPFDDPVAIICNEEGKLNRLPLNRALYTEDGEMFDIACGNIMICGLGEDNFASLQGELLEKYLDKYKHPEVFVKIGNDILAMKIPEPQKKEEQTQKNHIHRKI